MNTSSLVLLVVALFVGISVGIVLSLFKAKVKTTPKALLGAADTVIDDVKAAADTVGSVLLPAPENAILDKVLQAAQAGVHKAQQLFDNEQVTEDQRKQVAHDAAVNLLKVAGIKSSPEIETAIDDAIESGVFTMKNIVLPQAKAVSPITVAPVVSADKLTSPALASVAKAVQEEAQKASDQAVQGIVHQFTDLVQNSVQLSTPAADTQAATTAEQETTATVQE